MGDNESKQQQKRQDETKQPRKSSSRSIGPKTSVSNDDIKNKNNPIEFRKRRYLQFDDGREGHNLSNTQVNPGNANADGNSRLDTENERMSQSEPNIPNITAVDNITSRSRQQSTSFSNVPSARVQSSENIHLQDNHEKLLTNESSQRSLGREKELDSNSRSEVKRDGKMVSHHENNIIQEFKKAMKQFQKMSREVDEMRDTNKDILRKISNTTRIDGSKEEMEMLSRIEVSFQRLKKLEERSQEKEDQLQILFDTIKTLSRTVDKLCFALTEGEEQSIAPVQNMPENNINMVSTDDEETDYVTEDIGEYEIDNVTDEMKSTGKEIEIPNIAKVTGQIEDNTNSEVCSSEYTDKRRLKKTEQYQRVNGKSGNEDKHSMAQNSKNIEKTPKIKATRNDIGFKRMLTDIKDDNRVYCLQNRIEETRNTSLEERNKSQNIRKETKQEGTRDQWMLSRLGLDSDGSGQKTSELLERLATMRTENGNEYRNLVANPSGLAREVIDESMWAELAQAEVDRVKASPGPLLKGPYTVLCLDISASMEGEPFKQMIILAKKFVNEMENNSRIGVLENIALVTCGHETRVMKHMCKDYKDIISCIDNLHPDGTSPLAGGLLMALAGAMGKGSTATFGDVPVSPRIILITDGKATSDGILDGPDESPGSYFDLQIQLKLAAVSRDLGRRGNRVFCIPVGEPNLENLKIIASESGGQIIQPNKLSYLTQMHINFALAMQLRMQKNDTTVDDATLKAVIKTIIPGRPDEDYESILDFMKHPEILGHEFEDTSENQMYKENSGSKMPKIGTRVKRGPDWIWKDQDSGGPGTVIGHQREGWVYVEWDRNDRKNAYRYGFNNEYDLTIIDKPRSLTSDELIATGCAVKRGPDWMWDDQDGGDGSIGYVFRVEENGWISVQWPNGNKKNYRFGADDSFDLVICDENDLRDYKALQSTSHSSSEVSSSLLIDKDSMPRQTHIIKPKPRRTDSTNTASETRKPSKEIPGQMKSYTKNPDTTNKVRGHLPSRPLSISEKRHKKDINRKPADGTEEQNFKKELELSESKRASKQKSLRKATELKSYMPGVSWSYQNDNGEWAQFPIEISEKIETAFSKKPNGTTVINLNNKNYRIHFPKMIQVDTESKETRPIQRSGTG